MSFTPPPRNGGKRPKLAWVIAGIVAGVVLLACCVGGSLAALSGDTKVDREIAQEKREAESGTAAAPVEEPSPPPAPKDEVAKIGTGQGFTYSDGVQVQVLSAAKFRPNSYAAGHLPGNQAIKFVVRITNGSKELLDLTMVQVQLKAGPNGTQAEQIFDTGIGSFNGSAAVGRNASASFGFSVPPGSMGLMNVEVSPSWNHQPAIFEGVVS